MKVVYVTSESYIDHSYTIVQELKKHISLTVFLQGKTKSKEIEAWCDKLNAIFVQRKRFRNPSSILNELNFILSINKLKPDIVWFNTLTIYQLFFAKLLIKRFFVTIHDVEKHPGGRGHGVLSVKMTMKIAKKNVCLVSETQAKLFKKYYGFEPPVFQLPIINYYRDISTNNPVKKQSDKLNFFFFGSIEQYKGIETLLEAAEILEKKDMNYCLNIYGKVKYDSPELFQKIKTLKNVNFYDLYINYEDVHSMYIQNDVLVLPYKQVTQCGPLLIAFDEKVPVLSSDLEGFKEYIENGKNGIFFNNTADDLADKMEYLMNNPSLIFTIKENLKTETHEKYSMVNLYKDYMKKLTMN